MPHLTDAKNGLATAGGVTYTYDGDGKRVKKSNGTLYWTGPGWDPLVETDLSGNVTEQYVFFNGERVARVDLPAGTVEYYFSDHLKSTDIVTNATGGIVRESDYVPYGSEVTISGTDPNRYKFTGKERDLESGLDNFDARFYSSPFGRFMTPDWEAKPTSVPYANFGNPQSLNLYSYVQNNPTTVGDPDGHEGSGLQELEQFIESLPPEARPVIALPPVATGLLIGTALNVGINAYANNIQAQADRQMEQEKEINRGKIEEAKEKAEPPKTSTDGATRQGGGRNDQKTNIERVDENKKNETNARKDVQRLKSLPVNQRPPTYARDLQRAQGALNRAIDKQKKSETHSRKTKKQ
jgi:RHS repeat-associated protein